MARKLLQNGSKIRMKQLDLGIPSRSRSTAITPVLASLRSHFRGSLALVLLLSGVLGVFAPRSALATSIIAMSDQQLALSSAYVVTGTVVSIESAAEPDQPIYTYIDIAPERVLKGNLPLETFFLKELGGAVDGRQEWIFGSPEYSVGEHVLLFIDQRRDGTLRTSQLSLGKFILATDASGNQTVQQDIGYGASVYTAFDGSFQPSAAPQAEMLSDMIDTIDSVAEDSTGPYSAPETVPAEVWQDIPREFRDSYVFLGSPSRWFDSDNGGTVYYSVDSTGDSKLGLTSSRAAVDSALAAWTDVSTASLKLADGGLTSPVPFNGCSGVNRVIFNDPYNDVQDPSGCAGTLAIGGFCSTYNTKTINGTVFNQITFGKVTFNNGWSACSGWTQCNVAEVATHELGHTIGFGHSADNDSIMRAYAHFDGRCATLAADDIAAVTFAYPLMGTPAPTSTFTVSPTPTITPTRTLTPLPPTATPTKTPTRTVTPTITRTSTPTQTPTRTATPSRTPTSTLTPTRTPTQTPVPPTATRTNSPAPTSTRTSVPTSTSSATATGTATPAPPTLTPTTTHTAAPTSTATHTATPTHTVPATPTGTNTTVPTVTQTNTAVPTATQTNTGVPTATRTNTAVPPTLTHTPVPTLTSTAVPPTLTHTPVPTLTSTAVPPTLTHTPVPTLTFTSVPPTLTHTPVPTLTFTAVPPTLTRTSVPSSTRTATALPSSTPTTSSGGTVDLALGQSASQSSTLAGSAASRAVDGNTDGNWSASSVTHTDYDYNAWWQVDLGSVQPISSIDIWPRTDCCSSRLSAFYVFVSDTPFISTSVSTTLVQPGVSAYYMAGAAVDVTSFGIGRTGRYVRVQLSGDNYLSLAEVQVWKADGAFPPTATATPGSTSENLAEGQAASQSSTIVGADASRAVDGSFDGNFNDGSVTHTNNDAQAWWQVDLGAVADISSIDVWPRTDCCSDRLSDFYVFVSDTPFTSNGVLQTLAQSGVSSYFHSGISDEPTQVVVGRSGRYVRVQLSGQNYLSLAEVQVWGAIDGGSGSTPTPTSAAVPTDTPAGGGDDIAFGKAVTQSSTGFGGVPERAADGNTDGNWADGSVTHTLLDTNPWWQVDLGAVEPVGTIDIWPRTDCCGDRLAAFWVFVSQEPFTSGDLNTTLGQPGVLSYFHEAAAGMPTTIDVYDLGRYVRVQLSSTDYLSLTEVQVWRDQGGGEPPTPTFTPTPTPTSASGDLALGAAASQSSTLDGAVASRGVDGDTNGAWSHGSITHTQLDAQAWWEVDLGAVEALDSVDVWGRTDCCADRLSDFYVLVSDVPFASTDLSATLAQSGVRSFHVPGQVGSPTTLAVGGTGRYVRVQLSGTSYLSLAEVQVWQAAAPSQVAPAVRPKRPHSPHRVKSAVRPRPRHR